MESLWRDQTYLSFPSTLACQRGDNAEAERAGRRHSGARLCRKPSFHWMRTLLGTFTAEEKPMPARSGGRHLSEPPRSLAILAGQQPAPCECAAEPGDTPISAHRVASLASLQVLPWHSDTTAAALTTAKLQTRPTTQEWDCVTGTSWTARQVSVLVPKPEGLSSTPGCPTPGKDITSHTVTPDFHPEP